MVETLPDGFTYVSSSGLLAEDVSVSGQVATGQVVTFTLFGTTSPTTFTYTVTASDVAIEHTFSGDFSGVNAGNDPFSGVDVGGDSTVTVEAGTTPTPEPTAEPTASPTPGSISATRSFDETLVAPGEQVEVTITAQGHGTFADVVETLPAGFTYESSSGLLAEDVSVSGQVATGQVVTFTLFSTTSPTTFTYTVNVTAASADGANFVQW